MDISFVKRPEDTEVKDGQILIKVVDINNVEHIAVTTFLELQHLGESLLEFGQLPNKTASIILFRSYRNE